MSTVNALILKKENVILEIKQTTAILFLAVLIPFLIHFIPVKSGVPAGALFLAMFYAPLAAMKLFKFRTAILASTFAPMLNYFITGNPDLNLIIPMTFELLIFTFTLQIFSSKKSLKYFAPVISFLTAKLISILFFALLNNDSIFIYEKFLGTINISLPGILILSVLNQFLISNKNKFQN